MTIGLANASRKARNAGAIVNRNQGGGDKKCGFPYQVGRTQWTSIYFGTSDPVNGRCATLPCLSRTLVFTRLSRPVGSWTEGNSYWSIPGAP